MSRLDELIKELCPNGVEYKELGEVCITVTSPVKLKKTDYKIQGKIPIIDQGEEYIAGYTDLNEYLSKDEYILFGDHSEIIKYVNFEFIQGADGLKILKTKNQIKTKYIYYCFNNFYKKENGYKRHWSNAKMILVPIPPLEVQKEIVRILDNYTKSVEELKEKLNAELIARKKQYSWYRDYLLKFENKVEIVKLKDIATEMYRGSGIKREEVRETGIPCVRYGEIYTEYGIAFKKTKSYTDENLITNKKYIEYGDILFAITGESVEEIGKSTAYIGKEKCLVGGDILVMKHKQDPVYLSYVLSTENVQKQKSKGKIKSKVVHTNATDIEEIEIPLPPLEVQKRIVEVLDNFEKICKELNIELSSEIEVKQKEYEFVRNYLLTFEEKSRQAILACELASLRACELASLRSKQQAQNLIKILQYVYGYVEIRLGDIGSIVRGNGLQKRDFTEEGVGCIHYGQIYTKYGMVAEKTISFVEESLAEKLRKVEKGDIIFAVTSENIEDLCKCVVWLGEDEIVTGGHTAILKHNQNSKFLAYYFQTEAFHSQKRKLATGTKVMDITATKLEEILISLPPLEEQKRIVDILDRFDKLCNDISEGLPAEIEARQKQYEYYREKLLSFKKL